MEQDFGHKNAVHQGRSADAEQQEPEAGHSETSTVVDTPRKKLRKTIVNADAPQMQQKKTV